MSKFKLLKMTACFSIAVMLLSLNALPVFAGTFFILFITGWESEIGSRTAYVMDIAFEIIIVSHILNFGQY